MNVKDSEEWQKLCKEFRIALDATYKPLGNGDWSQYDKAWQVVEDLKSRISEFRNRNSN